MKRTKEEKGITLLALVITIIVLLILAGITINLTIGQDGIIRRAQEAGKNYTNAADYEKEQLAEFLNEVDNIINGEKTTRIDGSFSDAKKVNTPKITGSGLTAIEIKTDGTLENADTSKEDWYSYDGSTNHWANAKTADGSMFVWIPRFAYKINADKSIDIVFLKNTSNLDFEGQDVTSTSYVDAKGVTGAYIVHPAFEDGTDNNYANGEWNKKIEGFWMAKFEAGYDGTAGQPNTAIDSDIGYSTIMSLSYNGSTGADKASNYYGTRAVVTKIKYPIFQANKPSMNYIGISDAFDLCKNMTSEKAPYGLTTNVKPHLTKNSEWGAVAYLTQSKYGRDEEEVTINNVTFTETNTIRTVTGYGASSISASEDSSRSLEALTSQGQVGSWTTSQGQTASSTKNIYGIYDLSGGLWEWTAGYITAGDNYTKYGGSLKGESNEYKSKYAGTSATGTTNYSASPNPARVGEAIWETSTAGTGAASWNGDGSFFPFTTVPFFIRGGYWGYAKNAGVFCIRSWLWVLHLPNGVPCCARC